MMTKEEFFTTITGFGVIKGVECSNFFVIFKVSCIISHFKAFVARPSKCNHWWNID